jgi:hypothetical protein
MASGIGWRGYARLGAAGYVLPYRRADLAERESLYRSETIHGGGTGQWHGVFHSEHNFAIGRRLVDGTIDTEVFGGTGNYALAFQSMLAKTLGVAKDDDRERDAGFSTSAPLVLSPGGGIQWTMPEFTSPGKAVVSNLALRGNPDGIVGSTFTIVSAGATFQATPADAPTPSELTYETDPQCSSAADDSNPVPYWASRFNIVDADTTGTVAVVDRIMDWDMTINNNSNPIYPFNGQNACVDVLQGIMEVSGSFRYYAPEGVFQRFLCHGAGLTISLGHITLHSDFVAFHESPVPAPAMNEPVVRTVQYRCFAHDAASPSLWYTVT